MPKRVTAREIIFEILKNMQTEPELYPRYILVPEIFHVYLHPEDHNRLAAHHLRIIEAAKQELEAAIDQLNQSRPQKPLDRLKGIFGGGTGKLAEHLPYRKPDGGWQIVFYPATEENFPIGDIKIESKFVVSQKSNVAGNPTMMTEIRQATVTTRTGAAPKSRQPVNPPSDAHTHVRDGGSIPFAPSGVGAFAIIRYESQNGATKFEIRKDDIVIGRGGPNCWVDLQIKALQDADTKMVSSEHIRLRRDPATGTFYIKDTSSNGTTVDGQRIQPSLDHRRVDRKIEVLLPASCRIGLADVVFLDFEVCR